MIANDVCKMSRTPYDVYRAVYKFRLQHGLECMDGPLSLSDLKCERVMKAVCATLQSVRDEVIVKDECHFGIIENAHFFTFVLICQQKTLNLDVIGKFTCDNDYNITCDACEIALTSSVTVVNVIDDQVDVDDDVEFYADDPGIMFPLNMPVPSKPVVGFDVKYVPYTAPEVREDSLDHVSVMNVNPGTLCTYVHMPIERYLPLSNLSHTVLEGNYELTVEGGKFLSRDEEDGEYSEKVKIVGEELEEYVPFLVRAETDNVSVRLNTRYVIEVDGYYLSDPSMKLFAMRFTNKCKKLFDMFISELLKLPKTQLVMHNLNVMRRVVYGWRMPGKELLNQVALMTGNGWACSIGYDKKLERWGFYRKWESWNTLFQKRFKRGYVFRSPLSIFDEQEFRYEGILHNNAEDELLRFEHSKKYDAKMSYVEYIEYCKQKRSAQNVALEEDIKYRRFLYNEFCEEDNLELRRVPSSVSYSSDDDSTHSCGSYVSRHSGADLYNEQLYEPDAPYEGYADAEYQEENNEENFLPYNSDEEWDEERNRRSQIWDDSLVDY